MAEHSTLPAARHAHLAERVSASANPSRTWTLRDDNNQQHHGVVRLSESPLVIDLKWRKSADTSPHDVGVFRLHLGALRDAGYVRWEREGQQDEIRLRFHRRGGVIAIQVREGDPELPIAFVPAT